MDSASALRPTHHSLTASTSIHHPALRYSRAGGSIIQFDQPFRQVENDTSCFDIDLLNQIIGRRNINLLLPDPYEE